MDDERLNLVREVMNYLLRLKGECSFLQAKASAFSIIRSNRTEKVVDGWFTYWDSCVKR